VGRTFPKRRRLRAQGEFRGIQARGRRFSRGSVVVVVGQSARGAAAATRLGMVVSRKVGTAVKRNAVKRWIREWFRQLGPELPRGLDLVVVAKPGAAERGHRAVIADAGALLAKIAQAQP